MKWLLYPIKIIIGLITAMIILSALWFIQSTPERFLLCFFAVVTPIGCYFLGDHIVKSVQYFIKAKP